MSEHQPDMRQLWRLTHDDTDDIDEELAIGAVLDAVRARATRAVVDTRGEGAPPCEVVAVQSQLMRVRAGHDVELDPVDDAQWELVRVWAPWSLRVTLHARDRWLASVDDCGASVRALLDAGEVAALADDGVVLELVGDRRRTRWWGR